MTSRLGLTGLLLLVLAPLTLAAESVGWRFDFEKGVPAELEPTGAAVTDDPKIVIDGKRSILADFTGQDGDWHEFLHTGETLEFQKGVTYVIRFDYRIVSNNDDDIEFYSQLRSRSGKGDVSGADWRWKRPTGYTSHINQLFTIPDDGGYFLMIGIRKRGAIAIDNLTIQPIKSDAPGKQLTVRTHPSLLERPRQAFDKLAKLQKINPLLQDMLIIALNEGAGGKASSRKDQIAEDLGIDFVDWNTFGPLAKQHGIRSSSGGTEYQEYYKFEPRYVDAKARQRLWDNRHKIFGDKGFVVTLNNTIVADESWGEGGYFTCHNGVNWHNHFAQTMNHAAGKYLAITQDNIACSVFNRLWGCYCPGCLSQFNDVLAERLNEREKADLGIDDFETFSIQDYIVDYGLIGQAAVDDGLVREYMKFQYTSGVLAWADCVDQAKTVAKKQARVLPCGGNQINIWGTWPYAVALSQFCDFVEIEELVGVKEEMKSRSLQYKMGLASGHHAKPVWVRGPVTDETQKKTPMLSTSYWTTHFAEGLANGGIRTFSLGVNKPWTGEPDTKDYLDDPDLYQLYVDMAQWMEHHRALLTNRQSQARVALVYSFPTLMFRRYSALRTPDDHRLTRFEKMAKILEREQIPYDVVVFGHPEIWDDTPTFRRIAEQYDLLVMPGIDAVTDDQLNLLREQTAQGLTVLTDEPFERDENLNLRAELDNPPAVQPLNEETVVRLGRQASAVSADVPDHVSVNLWRSCRGKSLNVHLLNYDVDIAGETITPVENVRLRVRLPEKFRLTRCLLSQFGQDDQEIEYERQGDEVIVTLAKLESYAIVSLTDARSIETTQKVAQRRRQVDRQKVKQLAKRYNLY